MATPDQSKAAPPPAPPKSVFAQVFTKLTTLLNRKQKGKEDDEKKEPIKAKMGEYLNMVWSKEYKRWITPGEIIVPDPDDTPPPKIPGDASKGEKDTKEKGKKKKPSLYANPLKSKDDEEQKSTPQLQEEIKKEEPEVKSQTQSQAIDEISSQSTKYKELEIQVEQLLQEKDMVEKKASEMEFMLNEYVDEMESEKAYYEEQNTALYKEKAENSLKLTEYEVLFYSRYLIERN